MIVVRDKETCFFDEAGAIVETAENFMLLNKQKSAILALASDCHVAMREIKQDYVLIDLSVVEVDTALLYQCWDNFLRYFARRNFSALHATRKQRLLYAIGYKKSSIYLDIGNANLMQLLRGFLKDSSDYELTESRPSWLKC